MTDQEAVETALEALETVLGCAQVLVALDTLEVGVQPLLRPVVALGEISVREIEELRNRSGGWCGSGASMRAIWRSWCCVGSRRPRR